MRIHLKPTLAPPRGVPCLAPAVVDSSVASSQTRQSPALVLRYSGGNVVSRLKTLCRILVRHRFLLSAGLSAAGGIILKSVVLIPVADPLFRYVALQRPGIYAAFVWSFAIFLFTTPFLMLFMCCSLLYIHFYEEETAVT